MNSPETDDNEYKHRTVALNVQMLFISIVFFTFNSIYVKLKGT